MKEGKGMVSEPQRMMRRLKYIFITCQWATCASGSGGGLEHQKPIAEAMARQENWIGTLP